LARMAALEGDVGEARRRFADARTTLAARGQRALLPIADYEEARLLERTAPPEAAELVARALEELRALGMDPWIREAEQLRSKLAAAAPDDRLPDGLTGREAEVLRLLAGGSSNKEIATALFISVATVERHIANVYDKIGVRGRAQATAYALRNRLVAS